MKFKEKHKLIILIVGIVIGILIICLCMSILKKKHTAVQNQLSLSQEESNLHKKTVEIIKTKNISNCQKISDQFFKKVCINNISLDLAKEKQDVSYCKNLDNQLVLIEDCEREIIFPKAIENENVNICFEASNINVQKECTKNFWIGMSRKKQEITLCDNIQEEKEKNYCYNTYLIYQEFSKNPNEFDCEKFVTDVARNDCETYKNNLKLKQNSCMGMKSLAFRTYCRSYYWFGR